MDLGRRMMETMKEAGEIVKAGAELERVEVSSKIPRRPTAK